MSGIFPPRAWAAAADSTIFLHNKCEKILTARRESAIIVIVLVIQYYRKGL